MSSDTEISKFLSYALRHAPGKVGIELDSGGWTELNTLLARLHANGLNCDEARIRRVVDESPKKRFAISEDGSKIRANQGHSINVELGLEPLAPPSVLYHGTALTSLPAIRVDGLKRMKRHHVHLSSDKATALAVGQRHGKPGILSIDAQGMYARGYEFFCSENGVWLTALVPVEFIVFP
ncbi:MAG: RNA 2'-phosphotransferase [Planctomycetaceae bacterium]|nr:RNA 2'-phosphotransferase [Planctomycetaceae bacterium]